eukprot:2781278-Prymnesium_polylepis.1
MKARCYRLDARLDGLIDAGGSKGPGGSASRAIGLLKGSTARCRTKCGAPQPQKLDVARCYKLDARLDGSMLEVEARWLNANRS